MQLIFHIYLDSENCKVYVYSDQPPYKRKQKFRIRIALYTTSLAIDRRSNKEKNENKMSIIVLSDD